MRVVIQQGKAVGCARRLKQPPRPPQVKQKVGIWNVQNLFCVLRRVNGAFAAPLRTQLCDTQNVKGSEFLRKLRAIAKRRELDLRFAPARGKGSHGTVYLGATSTTLKDLKKEIGPGLLHAMCKDLGVDPKEL